MAEELIAVKANAPAPVCNEDEVEVIPLKGVRKVIAKRMLESLQTTAQLTLFASAEASTLLTYRKLLKQSAEGLGAQGISINDLILFGVSRIVPQFPEMNALFDELAAKRIAEPDSSAYSIMLNAADPIAKSIMPTTINIEPIN